MDIQIDRGRGAHGLSIADVQAVVSGAIGGSNIGETVEGLALSRSTCAIPGVARQSASATYADPHQAGQQITLGTVAQVSLTERAANAAQRRRASVRLGLCRCPWARPGTSMYFVQF